ncbi:MAG: VCBS repeat-containing protein, partial [Actinomycetota bacterium]|nr:VCBS repeat-containing protein [Actinomycetota bacterium]
MRKRTHIGFAPAGTRGEHTRPKRFRPIRLAAFAALITVALGAQTPATAGPPSPHLAFVPAPSSPVTVGARPSAIVAADFDADGYLDFATANRDGGTVSVVYGAGAAGFHPGLDVPTG